MTKPGGLYNDPRRQAARLANVTPSTPAISAPHLVQIDWQADRLQDDAGGALGVAARATFKHARLIALCVAAALALGAAVTLLTRPIYTARTTLQIDRETERVVSADDPTPLDNFSDEFFQTQYGLLRSRALATRVAESLGLIADASFVKTMTAHAAAKPLAAEARRQRVIDLLRAHEGVNPERGSRLVAITFSSPDPALSARIANAFAENFIASALDRRFESASYARDFLEKHLSEIKAKLEQSERDLVAYASSQQIIQLPAVGQPSQAEAGPSLAAANLESFNTALAAARAERIKAEQKWRQAQATSGAGLSEILQSPTFQVLSQQRAILMAEYEYKLRIFKPDYPDMAQLKARIDEADRQLASEAWTIRQSLRAQYEAALSNEQALSAQVDKLKSAVLNLRERSIRYMILQREVDTNRTLYDGLLQRYKEVGVAGGVAANNISIVDPAETPLKPSSPRPLLNMALAGLVGVAAGVGLACLREALDQAIRSPADVEADLPLLGAIPLLKGGEVPRSALADPRSPMAEAYHALRSALQFSTPDGLPKTLMVTSPAPGGGKTTTAFAVAQYVARLGFRVLLVDADLRNPSLATLLALKSSVGLSSLLTGAAALKEAVQPTELLNLFVVTAGPPAPNPAELLGGSRLPILIAEGSAVFDMIVFDGPPIMGLADAPMIGAVVAACLMVVEAGRTTRTQLRQSLRRMSLAGAHILGAVLTKHRARRDSYGYGYGYGYDYAYGRGRPDARAVALGGAANGTRGVAALMARARRLVVRYVPMNRAARRMLDGALALTVAALAVLIVRAAAANLAGPDPAPAPTRLARDPLDLPALRELALQLDREGRLDQADALLGFVGRRTWRDGPTEVWLLRRRLDQGRYREAFESADSLLRRDADGTTRPTLFDLFMAAAADPAARPALATRLQAAPWWRGDFLRTLGARGAAAGARAVFSQLALGPTAPGADEYAPFIDRLMSAGDYEGAYAAWLRIARPRDLAPADLRDGDFTGGSDYTPFTWSRATGVGASSEIGIAPDTSARALRIDYDGYSAPSLPAQLLLPPPGRYLVSWRERLDPPVPERMFWRVRCAGTNRILARAPSPGAGWREATMSVETPGSGCAAQWLELAVQAGERRAPVTGWYATFRLRPLP